MQKEEERAGGTKSNLMVGPEKSLALIHDFPVLCHLNWLVQNQTSFVSSDMFL